MKKIICGLVALMIVGVLFNIFIPGVTSVKDLTRINYTKTMEQENENYFVYFYQETCGLCLQLEPKIMQLLGSGENVYLVDMAEERNLDAWYDWEMHHEKFDKVIGKVENGEQVLNEGETLNSYPMSEWSVIENGEEVIASNNIAQNNKEPKNAEEIEISGTPTIVQIQNGNVINYAQGLIECENLILNHLK